MIAENTIHPFESREGFSGIGRKGFMALILLGLMSAVIARFEFIGITVLLGLSAALAYGYVIFQRPIIGLYTALGFSFLLIGAGRYVKDVQVGLGMDLIIIVTYLAFFFKRFYGRIDWSPANRDITWISFVWFLYSVFQIFNPESSSLAAWFSGRSIGVHFFLLVPLALLFMDSVRKIRIFIIIWCVFSLLASVKGILQVHIGLDAWERGWLEEGNYKTHVLFGKLRAFSFLSDAGQFGANQGYTAVVAFITGIASKKWSSRIFFFLVAALAIYGLVISGSRGSLSVPLAGFCLFLLLKKNFALLSMGALIMSGILYFFMFTSIGQGNADIRRMRTAFDPNDASLQVRLNNQRVLKTYMASGHLAAESVTVA